METNLDTRKIVIPTAIIGILGLLITTKPFLYVTPPGYATVVFNSFRGLIEDRIEPPGVTFIAPVTDRPITYNVRTQVWEFTSETGSRNRLGNGITVNTADGQAFSIDVYIALRPNQATLDDLHARLGESFIETVVIPVVRSKIRDISAEFTSQDFYIKERRTEIEEGAQELISSEMPTAASQGQDIPMILIEGIFLGTPNFPPGLVSSIEEKQVASITAQTAAVRAQIQERETERVLIEADANQTAIELQGEAASTNAQLADLIFYERLQDRIRSAQSSQLQVIRVETEDSTIFLNVDPKSARAVQQQSQPTPVPLN